MRARHSWQAAIFAVLATTSLAANAAEWPEKDVTTQNITKVTATIHQDGDRNIGQGGQTYRFYKIWKDGQLPNGWFEVREGGGSSGSLLEETHDTNSITISEGPRRFTVDLARKTISGAKTGSDKPIAGTITEISADTCRNYWGTVTAGCACDLRWLRPLQGSAGLGEVEKKTKDVEDDFADEKTALANDPIKVVTGPRLDLYVVDHHHGALAWLNAGYTLGVCKSHADISADDDAVFWAAVAGISRLRGANGEQIIPSQLPATVKQLPDDPYRTLAWMVRKVDGFCRALMLPSPPPFAEFSWADAMREKLTWDVSGNKVKVPRSDVEAATAPSLWEPRPGEKKKDTKGRREAAQKPVLDAAFAFARSNDAKDSTDQKLPGWNGERQLTGLQCNPKDD